MVRSFLFEFGTLFAIINPYGMAFVFLSRTMSLTEAERRSVARQVAINAFVVLIGSLFLGALVLSFFGVSIAALRIAGGLVVAISGWHMLHDDHSEEVRGPTSNRNFETLSSEAFFPLTVPLTTGPGTIATAITLAAGHSATRDPPLMPWIVSTAVAFVVSLAIYHAFARVSNMARLIGGEGTRVVVRLSAFLLLCVGVQIMMTGASEFLARSSSADDSWPRWQLS